MGRGGRPKPWRADNERGYELWRGTWSPSLRDPSQRPWRRQGGETAEQPLQFPSYTAMQPQSADRQVPTAMTGGTAPEGRAQGVQALLNPARKAEQRLHRLQSARTRTAAQFEAFLAGMKKSFIKELTKFQNDTTRIDQAINDATQEQERAFATIRQAILGGVTAGVNPAQPAPAAESVWEQMTATWEQEDGDFLQEVLRGPTAPRQAAPPRQLTPEAQQLLAHFGATHAPMAVSGPSGPVAGSHPQTHPPVTVAPPMSNELQEILRHFGAAAMAQQMTGPSQSVSAHPGVENTEANRFYNGLDPALFEPCNGAPSEVVQQAERMPSSSISPGAKAKRALVTGALPRRPLKTHTKPSPTKGQANLAQKLQIAREAAALKEAAEQAFHLSQSAKPAVHSSDVSVVNGQPPQQPAVHPASAALGGSGESAALRPFGRPAAPKPSAPIPMPGQTIHGENRKIAIEEALTEEEAETMQDTPGRATLRDRRKQSNIHGCMQNRCSRLSGLGAWEIHWEGSLRTFIPVGQCYTCEAYTLWRFGLLRFHSELHEPSYTLLCTVSVQRRWHITAVPCHCCLSSPLGLGSSLAAPSRLALLVWEGSGIGPHLAISSCVFHSRILYRPLAAPCTTEQPVTLGQYVSGSAAISRPLWILWAYASTHSCRVPNSCIGGSGTATRRIKRMPRKRRTAYMLARLTCHFGLRFYKSSTAPTSGSPSFMNDGALNTRIGSSGTGARRDSIDILLPFERGCFWHNLTHYVATNIVVPFFGSLLVIVAAAIVKAYTRSVPGRHTPLGRLIAFPTCAVPTQLLLPIAVASPGRPVLAWAPPVPPKHRPRTRRQSVAVQSRVSARQRLLLAFLGFASMPRCVWAMPTFPQTPEVMQLLRHEYARMSPQDPSESRYNSASEDSLPAPDPLPGDTIDPPRHVHGPAPYSTDFWLGITVYAPHVAPAAFAMKAERTATLETIISQVRSSGRVPHPGYDAIVPVSPQMHDDYLALIAYPTILAQYRVPRYAIVIDLTRVGGHCHAAVFRDGTTAQELLQQVRLEIRADIDDADLRVWVGDATLPASNKGILNVSNGTLLTIMRVPHHPGRLLPASALFVPEQPWGRIDHMPVPPRTHSLALCRGPALDAVCPSFFPWAQPEDIARQVYRLQPGDDQIVVISNDPVLDVQGEPCAQTAIALPRHSTLMSHAHAQPYFLDLRHFCEAPRLVLASPPPMQVVDLPQLLAEAQVELPPTYVGMLVSNRLYGDLQVLCIALEVGLEHRIFSIWPQTPADADEPEDSVPAYGNAATVSDNAAAYPPRQHPYTGADPPRFGQHREDPTAEEASRLADPEQIFEQEAQQPVVAHFVVFIPSFRPEYIRLTMSIPCALDDALAAVSNARCSAASVHFDNLIPVEPQPDPAYGCLLAIPDWVTTQVCCLIDTRSIDGRLFAGIFFSNMKRSWILLHIGVADAPQLQVYVAETLLDDHQLYPVYLGATVTVLPGAHAHQPGPVLADMLLDASPWQEHCPNLDGPDSSSFLVLSDGGYKVMPIDQSQTLTPQLFKRLSVDAFQYSYANITVPCPAGHYRRSCARATLQSRLSFYRVYCPPPHSSSKTTSATVHIVHRSTIAASEHHVEGRAKRIYRPR